jgi:hypothetical protein
MGAAWLCSPRGLFLAGVEPSRSQMRQHLSIERHEQDRLLVAFFVSVHAVPITSVMLR